MGFRPNRSEEVMNNIAGLNARLVGGAVKWDEDRERWIFELEE